MASHKERSLSDINNDRHPDPHGNCNNDYYSYGNCYRYPDNYENTDAHRNRELDHEDYNGDLVPESIGLWFRIPASHVDKFTGNSCPKGQQQDPVFRPEQR